VPICFPWFRGKADDPEAPAHGVVRTRAWQLDSLTQAGEDVTVSFSITSDESTRHWWPHDFLLVHRVTVGTTLRMELICHNTGTSPLRFEEALHTYHRVADVRQIRVSGLNGLSYLDNMEGNREKPQQGDLRFSAASDSAYLDAAHGFELQDPVLGRRIRTEKENSRTTVAWNPWAEGAAALVDLGNEEWPQMACVEASNILDAAVNLAPGEHHAMAATLSVLPGGD
jgi:glucose-6-phosphate 1-epimerase